ncbi:hypothetical protein ACFY4C_15365 [Actinomadura viridis]|uniref:VHL beta domain-containing protein n=1 Tax=Actinomadura viridis TaxID=58110 RepID=UPI0036CC0AE4
MDLEPLTPALEGSLRSENGSSTCVEFVNTRNDAVNIYWLDWAGGRVFYRRLMSGDRYIQQTYVTHPWVVCNVDDEPLRIFQPIDSPARAVIR